MKSINLGSAVLAGAIGTFAMTALMYAAPLMGLPPMDLLWSGLFLALGYSFGWRPESLRDGYRAGATVLLSVVGAGVGTYVLIKLFRRWRHGPASFREGMVARVVNGLLWLRRRALACRGHHLRALVER